MPSLIFQEEGVYMSLSQAQNQAITHREGPCMVLAGPGSGKTFTITRRIEHLIRAHQVKPEEILVITFTKAAANEMRNRFRDLMGKGGSGVTFGTFHGVYYGILKWAYKLQAESILSEEEKIRILGEVLKKEQIDVGDEKEFLQAVISEISLVKNNRENPETYQAASCDLPVFRNIYAAYEHARNARKKLDFDDMLTETLRLFQKRPDILKLWQEKFRYILIDEFQDINPVQYEVIRMLALPENNLFIVGDDDQSIYGFRGARPDIMLDFPKDYPETKVLYLSENYRSTKAIVNAASRVIGNNVTRYGKEIKTLNEQGDTVHIQEVLSPLEESRYVAAEIRKLLKKGVAARKIAVLFRSGVDARSMVETCLEYQIPFHMKEQVFNLYEHFIGRDLRAYLRMAMGDRSRRYFLAVMNRPNRYLARNAVEETEVSFEELRTYYADMDWMQERIDRLEVDLRLLGRMAPYAAIRYIRKSIGYDEYLKEYAAFRNIRGEELFEILADIEERAKDFRTLEEWFAHIEDYTRQLQLRARESDTGREEVQFMTMHSAKGLEFDAVFIIGANEKIIPHKKAGTREEIEEERRLFYVAMTRAKRKLVISYARERNGKQMQQSRFVGEVLAGTKWGKESL